MASTFTTGCGLHLALEGGMIFPLTDCCRASGKGGDGVVCRACREPVADLFGDCALEGDWARVEGWLTERGCPCADECSAYSTYRLEVA